MTSLSGKQPKRIFISKNYRDRFTASSKAKLDAETIAEKAGFRNIGLEPRSIQNPLLGRLYTAFSNLSAWVRMPANGICFLQFPVNFNSLQIKRAKKRGNYVVILIHDINSLRDMGSGELDCLHAADLLIAHTPAMRQWLLDNKIHHNVGVLGIFDYLGNSFIVPVPEQPYKIAFAGNLGKSKFLEKLTNSDVCQYKLFGIGYDKLKISSEIEYGGCFPPEELPYHLNTHFGLVWDGDSVNGCNGINGDYLKLISPHKLSMYISVGLPVIVWEESAIAHYVRDKGIGLTVSTLQGLPSLLKEISKDTYYLLKKNTIDLSRKLQDGKFLYNQLSSFI